ncbi:hypothetical protein ACJ3XI_07260 [Litorimonas sp. RW-G-Af-16]|uniref:hypothetical protein n=1 Tax=Litorimonas sp. RW-G-Af-16 TaxID=3241168 RepID=UPI00390CA76A
MSKRHRKTKDLFETFSGDYLVSADFDVEHYEAPRGKKPKGKHRREAHSRKRAYYDD